MLTCFFSLHTSPEQYGPFLTKILANVSGVPLPATPTAPDPMRQRAGHLRDLLMANVATSLPDSLFRYPVAMDTRRDAASLRRGVADLRMDAGSPLRQRNVTDAGSLSRQRSVSMDTRSDAGSSRLNDAGSSSSDSLSQIDRLRVEVLEPQTDEEAVIKFKAGLVTAVPVLVNLLNLERPDSIRIKVWFFA